MTRLDAAELIALVLHDGSWTSWDTPPEQPELSAAYGPGSSADRTRRYE